MSPTTSSATTSSERHSAQQREFRAGLAERHLGALWDYGPELLPREPAPRTEPHIWRYSAVRPMLLQAGEVVSPEQAERRALLMLNPGLRPAVATTGTLVAAMQLLLPGETARAHRHSPAALRFVIEGEGAHTTVDGERTAMRAGDLVLTPSFAWHDHEATGDGPVVWFDGLDLPLVTALEAVFFELHGDAQQPRTEPDDASRSRYGHGTLRPAAHRSAHRAARPHSPVVNYPWEATRDALESAAAIDPDAALITLDYINPDDGGPVMPTIGASAHRLAPGAVARVGRRTASSVVVVVRGTGRTRLGDTWYEWNDHDVIVCPPWTAVEHENGSADEPAVLFAMTDAPVLRALHLDREA